MEGRGEPGSITFRKNEQTNVNGTGQDKTGVPARGRRSRYVTLKKIEEIVQRVLYD